MTLSFHGLITEVPVSYWAGLGVGIVLLLIGIYSLYHELKATFTVASPPAVIERDHESLAVADWAFAWIGGIIFTFVGIGFLIINIANIYTCFIVKPPRSLLLIEHST